MNFITKNIFCRTFLIINTALFIVSCAPQQNEKLKIEWPQSTSETKPWTRWWWHGSAVTKEGITAELEELRNAGFGGVEITPIYGVKGFEDRDLNFLSKEWMEILEYTLKEGKRLNLGIDLANASGWPFGGPWISSEDACKNVKYKMYDLKGGESLKEKIEFIQEPLVRAVGHKVDISEVKFPISLNNNLQELALDQVQFKKRIPLQSVIAYNKMGEVFDLTDFVDQEGILNWKAGKGEWKLYAVFQGWHGKMVERAGRGGEGNVLDHFSESATKKFLDFFDQNANDFEINGLRAFFNDSYEVDDAIGESDWTPLFFDEFKSRRGYDLRNYLPALFSNDKADLNKRVICDYRETISDLLLEKFTNVWKDWSRKYNSAIRNQAHGSPANILDLYTASDIPETEGTIPTRIKMASSAGHVSGKPLIACEAATWLNEHFLSDLSQVKQNFDRYLANGINHIVYHGTPYSPVDESWPGWMFYASVHFAPTNTWWEDLKTINSYVTNCQSFLQNSKPANDILLYYPIYDKWSEQSKSMLQHFGTNHDDLIKDLSEKLLNEGYTFDYISDKQIEKLNVSNKKLVSANTEYKTLIIPKSNFIPLTTFEKLKQLAHNGAKIIFENELPQDVPGINNLQQRQEHFRKLKNQIDFEKNEKYDFSRFGEGEMLKGSDINNLLNVVNIIPESLVKNNLWFNKVNRVEGLCYFISNWSEKNVDDWINLNAYGKSAVWFNPINRKFGKAELKSVGESSKIYVHLNKGESLILQFYQNEIDIEEYPFYKETNNIISLNNEWEVEFVNGGPTKPELFKTHDLISWPNISEKLKSFSGTAKYSTTFNLEKKVNSTYLLDLGEVFNSAVVYVNGEKVSTLIGPEFKTVIKNSRLKETNKLEIYITNLMANRIIDMDKRGTKYKKFYNINFAANKVENLDSNGTFTSKHWEPLKSGLLGPVKMIKLEPREVKD